MLISYKNLRYGSSLSCGCYRRERAREAISPDLTGRQFGELKADSIQAGARWLCRCSCGAECKILGTLLVNGKATRCTGKAHPRNYTYKDITGQRFGRLTAISPTSSHDKSGYVIWLCRCDCGKEVEVSYNGLQYGNRKSCGCRKKQYILGSYDSIEEAAEDRREAEAVLFDGVSEHYRLWKEYADKNVGWAAANPVQVFVDRQNGKLQVALLPQIPK